MTVSNYDIGFRVAAVPEPSGDFDEDGDTDGADFLIWQQGDSPFALSDSDLAFWEDDFGYNADFDDDNDIDGADFLIWQRGESHTPLSAGDLAAWELNFGETLSSAVAAEVSTPEPSSLLLASLAGVLLDSHRRRV